MKMSQQELFTVCVFYLVVCVFCQQALIASLCEVLQCHHICFPVHLGYDLKCTLLCVGDLCNIVLTSSHASLLLDLATASFSVEKASESRKIVD